MRRMIGPHNVNRPILYSLPQGFGMFIRHPETETIRAELLHILPGRKKERPGIHLGGYRPTFVFCPPHHFQSAGRAHMENMEFRSGRFLKTYESRDGGVPNDAVEIAVRFAISLRAAIPPPPVSLLDLIHQVLIVGVGHERQSSLAHGLETAKEIAVVVQPDAGHM